jgi:hypothetical protein
MNKLIGILLALAASVALADNAAIIVQPNGLAQVFADAVQHSQPAWQEKGKQLGNLVVPQIIGVVIGTQCGKYTQAVIGYSDGSQRNLPTIAQDDATQGRLKMLIAAAPNTTVVDLGCSPK